MARNRKTTPLEQSIRKERVKTNRKLRYWQKNYGASHPTAPNILSNTQISRLAGSQRSAYLRQLQQFNQERFVANSQGKPIPLSAVKKYKALEATVNKSSKDKVRKYGSVKIPSHGTIKGYMRMMDQSGLLGMRMSKRHASGTYITLRRDAQGFTNANAIDKGINSLQDRLNGKDLTRLLKNKKSNLRKMVNATGDDELWKRVKALSRHQLDVLINLTPFMSEMGFVYKHYKEDGSQKMAVTARSHAYELIDAIESQVPAKP